MTALETPVCMGGDEMSRHTPGDWYTQRSGFSTVYVFSRRGGGLIQEVAACGPTYGHDEQENNAKLIAAAPELLAACLKMSEWDAREKDHAIGFYERLALCDEAFTMMRAAITKATGETI